MSKIFDLYTVDANGKNVDRTWYNSSNVKYSECDDLDNELKTLRVVFNNGAQYQYKGVNVNQFLLFREDVSQGKALNKYIKDNGYEYERIGDADISAIDEELRFRSGGGMFLSYKDGYLELMDYKDRVLFQKETELSDEQLNVICGILNAAGNSVKMVQ